MNTHPLIGKYFPVLDHGFVALVDYMGDDQAIVQAARTSYGFGTKSTSEDRGLIRYLMRLLHTGPFEMAELKFHVRLPIFVARQLVRHRTASLNEQSLRYSLAPLQFYTPAQEAVRKQSFTNKQGRSDATLVENLYAKFKMLLETVRGASSVAYVSALEDDIARELARIDLPLSLYTEWYWKLDLHNLLHFLKLRADSHAQWEIQEYARVKGAIVKALFPLSFEAWMDYSFGAKTFSRMDLNVVRQIVQERFDWESRNWDMSSHGLTKREADELYATLFDDLPALPSFELDMESAKTAEHFYEAAKAAVPEIKKADA